MSRREQIRIFAEKLIGRYYEGPSPPVRLAEQVVAFGAGNPTASREEWAVFVTRLVQSAYRDGFTRGREWEARDLDSLSPDAPLREAEEASHNFAWESPARMTADQLAERVDGEFFETLPDDEQKARYLDTVGRYQGNFRMVAIPPGKRVPGSHKP